MGFQSTDRERRVVDAFKALWSPSDTQTSALVVGDRDRHLEGYLSQSVGQIGRWSRWMSGHVEGRAWPPGGDYDFATLRLPREKDTLRFCIETIAAQLPAGATLWVYGANDEGIKSVARHLSPLFDAVTHVGSKHHCRMWRGQRTHAPARASLSEWTTQRPLTLPSGTREWQHLPGVFAKGELDAATKLLLESLDSEESPKNILDFACGGGVIGAELSARWPKAELSGLDADAIALHVAALNAPYSKLYLSDSWSSLQSQTYDLIVSNPPIHRGKSEDHQALDSLIVHARAYLNPGGRLWLVGQRRLGLGRRLQGSLKGQCVKDDGRFQVWSAQ